MRAWCTTSKSGRSLTLHPQDAVLRQARRDWQDNDELRPGLAPIAPGDFHMVLGKAGLRYHVAMKNGLRV